MATIRRRQVWRVIDQFNNQICRAYSEASAKQKAADHPGSDIKVQSLGWEATVRRKGHKPVSKTFTLKSQAEAWATDTESDMGNSAYIDKRKSEKVRLEELFSKYRADITTRKALSSQATESGRLNALSKKWGHIILAQFTDEHVVDHVFDRLDAERSSDTIRKELNLVRDVINTARALWKYRLPFNPVDEAMVHIRKKRLLAPPEERDRRISDQEEKAILKVKHKQPTLINELYLVAVDTAMRRGEIAASRREHVNFKDATQLIPDSKTDWKTGKGRVIPLTPRVVAIYKSLPEREDGLLWGIQPGSISQAFDRAVAKAEVDEKPILDLTWHDIRHEATSRLFEKGLEIMEVASITGHRDPRSLKRYTHIKPKKLAVKLALVSGGQ